jgi:hypothetical protein
LLIALPLSAVIGGLATLYIAVSTSDGLVVDDYYRRGKEINRDLARDHAAAAHGLQARLFVDAVARRVTLQLTARDYTLPQSLRFAFLHPTRQGFDQHLVLPSIGEGRYGGMIEALPQANWYVQLEADDWRLQGRVQLPQQQVVTLVPSVPEHS